MQTQETKPENGAGQVMCCPRTIRHEDDVIGCGSTNVAEDPSEPGIFDCFDCGIHFTRDAAEYTSEVQPPRQNDRPVALAVATVAAGIGGLNEILSNEYALTVRLDGRVCRQLEVAATGDDFWVGARLFVSGSGKPDGEVVEGKHFLPAEVELAIAFGKAQLDWVHASTNNERKHS